MQTDPIADFLTAIRNANTARKDDVTTPSSKLKVEIARIFERRRLHRSYEVTPDSKQGRYPRRVALTTAHRA
jgi:small subunit ribosomal protein S8